MLRVNKAGKRTIPLFSSQLRGANTAFVPQRNLVSSSYSSLNEAEKKACSMVEKGEALAKIIPEEMLTFAVTVEESLASQQFTVCFPWNNHLKQLADYSYRPDSDLDNSKADGVHWEYHHLTQAIERNQKSEVDVCLSTQETSMTLISSQLHTPLFHVFEKCNAAGFLTPTGLLYRKDDCEMVALFSDVMIASTAQKRWIAADRESLVKYKQDIAGYSFTNGYAFQRHIDRLDNDKCNEVLAKVKREALFGLVVDASNMSKEAIKSSLPMIRKRKADVKDRLSLDLPILFYHSKERHIQVYSQDELDLVELKEQLEKKLYSTGQPSHLPSLGLFAPEDLSYSFDVKGFMKGQVDRKTALDIIRLINMHEKQGIAVNRVKEMIQSKCGLVHRAMSHIVL